MALLTAAQLRSLAPTSLEDAALEILLAAAEQEIDRHAGAAGDVTERFRAERPRVLGLARPAALVVSVTQQGVALDPTDYALECGGELLRRLHDGANPAWRWWGHVTVVYTPVDDTASRQRVQAELVRLDIAFTPGLASQQIGTWTETYATSGRTYAEQRADILASLAGGLVVA